MIAAIPTIGEAPQLRPLVHDLLYDGAVDEVLLYVNRYGVQLPPMPSRRVHRIDRPGASIYAEWNAALRYGAAIGQHVAILNDDIELAPGAIGQAAALMALDASVAVVGLDYTHAPGPARLRQVHGTFRHGGIGGFAFIADPSKVEEVDESFEWWYGDDDLVLSAEKAGWTVAIADGCHVAHEAETTARKHPWTSEAKDRDRERFAAKYGREAA